MSHFLRCSAVPTFRARCDLLFQVTIFFTTLSTFLILFANVIFHCPLLAGTRRTLFNDILSIPLFNFTAFNASSQHDRCQVLLHGSPNIPLATNRSILSKTAYFLSCVMNILINLPLNMILNLIYFVSTFPQFYGIKSSWVAAMTLNLLNFISGRFILPRLSLYYY
jgi:hypothetical protein